MIEVSWHNDPRLHRRQTEGGQNRPVIIWSRPKRSLEALMIGMILLLAANVLLVDFILALR